MGRHQHPLSCTGAPTQEARAAQDDPMPGYMLWLCHGLASDAAGSSVSTGAQPAPLLVPSTLLAPRTGSLGHGTGLSHGTAGQPRCGCRRFAAGTGRVLWPAVLQSCAGECAGPARCLPGCWAQHQPFPSLPCNDCCLVEFIVYQQRSSTAPRRRGRVVCRASPTFCIVLIKSKPWPFDFSTCFRIKPSLGLKRSKPSRRQTFLFLCLLFWQRLLLLCGFSHEWRVLHMVVRSQALLVVGGSEG